MGRGPGWSVVLDFDGTVTMEDVGDSILRRFAGLTPAEIRASYHPRVATEVWMREKFLQVRGRAAEIRSFILRTARPRPGFLPFLRWCRAAGVPVEIVSGGVDLYMDPLLRAWRSGPVRRFRAGSRLTERGIVLDYSFLRGEPLDVFKRRRVEAHKRRGRRVLFAGDGTSDLLAARGADAAFARASLLRHCRSARIPARRLTTFEPLRRHLAAADGMERDR